MCWLVLVFMCEILAVVMTPSLHANIKGRKSTCILSGGLRSGARNAYPSAPQTCEGCSYNALQGKAMQGDAMQCNAMHCIQGKARQGKIRQFNKAHDHRKRFFRTNLISDAKKTCIQHGDVCEEATFFHYLHFSLAALLLSLSKLRVAFLTDERHLLRSRASWCHDSCGIPSTLSCLFC